MKKVELPLGTTSQHTSDHFDGAAAGVREFVASLGFALKG